METIRTVFIYVTHIIDVVAVVLLVFGIVKILLKYIKLEAREISKTHVHRIQKIRCELGVYILLALDLLIAKDIIHTVTDLSQERLIELGALIVLRSIIGYFIGREVETIEKEGYIE